MAESQELLRRLLAAGFVERTKKTHLLYTEGSSLVSKVWTGTSYGDQELVSSSVRPESQAAYLLTDSTNHIIGISPTSSLFANRYDEDEGEWIEIEGFPHPVLHPESKLAAFVDAEEFQYVFFQDPSGHLVYLDDSGASTVLPAEPVVGSPLSVLPANGTLSVFYISSTDNGIHYVAADSDGKWSDAIMSTAAADEKLKQMLVSLDEEKAWLVYGLTEENTVLQITKEKKSVLGKVDKGGDFVPDTTAEWGCCINFDTNIYVQVINICRGGHRRRRVSSGSLGTMSTGNNSKVPHGHVPRAYIHREAEGQTTSNNIDVTIEIVPI